MLDQTQLNKYVYIIAMDLILKEESFRSEFLNIAQPIYADVISFSQNPNCSCKTKVGKFIGANLPIVISLVNSWDQRNPGAIDLEKIEKDRESIVPTQKVYSINGNIESYELLLKDFVEKKVSYRGLNIIVEGEKWLICLY